METRQIISQIVKDLGPLVDQLHEVTEVDPGRWVLQFTEDAMLFTLDENDDRLYVTMEIGPLPEDRQGDVMRLLLAFNSMWAETGGISMALTRPEGNVTQIFDLLTSGIELTKVARIVDALLARADSWKALLAGAETSVPDSDESPGAGAIRV